MSLSTSLTVDLPPHRTRRFASTRQAWRAVIITKDEDFAIRRLLREGPSIVWVRIGNTRRAGLLRRIETELSAIVTALDQGETLVEIV